MTSKRKLSSSSSSSSKKEETNTANQQEEAATNYETPFDRFRTAFLRTDADLHDVRLRIMKTEAYQNFLALRAAKHPNKSYWHRTFFRVMIVTVPSFLAMYGLMWFTKREYAQIENDQKLQQSFEPSVILNQLKEYDKPPGQKVQDTMHMRNESFYSSREAARLNFEDMSLHKQLEEMNQKLSSLKEMKRQQQHAAVNQDSQQQRQQE